MAPIWPDALPDGVCARLHRRVGNARSGLVLKLKHAFSMAADALHHQSVVPDLGDAALAYMAEDALARNQSVPRGAVRANAVAGWLTLSGVVRSQRQREEAAACVRNLPFLTGLALTSRCTRLAGRVG